MSAPTPHAGFHGPRCWAVSIVVGLAAGGLLTRLLPAPYHDGHAAVPIWLVAPFALLLASIALMPFLNPRLWHRHFPDFAFALGGVVVGYYLLGFRAPDAHSHGLGYGAYTMLHTLAEYYAFIAIVGGLYVVSGGILIEVRGKATPGANTAILAVGAVIANVVGTTGASMLLIRPFMRLNKGRLRPDHIVFFIFIVSNCGGCLTPVGDPPLYLGYLKGVPFFWVLEHMWYDWAFTVGSLLAVFYAVDRWVFSGESPAAEVPAEFAPPAPPTVEVPRGARVSIRGGAGLISLGLILGAVFINPALTAIGMHTEFPVGATCVILISAGAYLVAPRAIHEANGFTFFPVKEVGLLFLGIFATMAPALGYLAVHGRDLGVTSPTALYFATGGLSAILDNAPTYLNFLQIAMANPDMNPLAPGQTAVGPETIRAALAPADGGGWSPGMLALNAISTGAVFFGAMTYIGNGPNFMVKAIAEDAGVRMPSFFGYVARALAILLPVLVAHWAIFIR